ncbi:MAG: ComEC/Rec2 family competence protein [Bergeyella sp.]|nr:ComEC/Rec2 family competence protein [Bergeyella sp.]
MLIGYILGLLFENFFFLSGSCVYALVILSVVGACIPFIFKKSYNQLSPYTLVLQEFLLLGFFFTLGVLSYFLSLKSHDFSYPIKPKEKITFSLQHELKSNEKYRKYEVKIHNLSRNTLAIFSHQKKLRPLDFQHYYTGTFNVYKLKEKPSPYSFDYKKYLERKGIHFLIYSDSDLSKTKKNPIGIGDRIKEKRRKILIKIDRAPILSSKNKELIKAIVLADKSRISPDITSDFTHAGLAHILTISGAHMAVIFWMTFSLLSLIFSYKYRKIVILISLTLIWCFCVFIGYGNPIVRSCIMITVYYLYVLTQRTPNLLHSLSLSAFIILIFDPFQIFDLGFQLSFSAVLGIYWLYSPIVKALPENKSKLLEYFTKILALTLSAQIATLPLILYYFHQFYILSVLANLVIVPLTEIVIISSLFMVFIVSSGIKIPLLFSLYNISSEVFLSLVHFFSSFPSFILRNIPLDISEFFVLCTIIFSLRFLILQFSLKNILISALFLFLFFSLRLALNFHAYNTREVLSYNLGGKHILSVKEKNTAIFFVPKNTDKDHLTKYIITPYITHSRVKNYQIVDILRNNNIIRYKGKNYTVY